MTEEQQADDISMNELFELLASDRRRAILEYLLRHGDSAAVDDLVDYVVAETETASGRSDRDLHAIVGASLHHVHLPKMEDVGIIEYDTERKLVRETADLQGFEQYLT